MQFQPIGNVRFSHGSSLASPGTQRSPVPITGEPAQHQALANALMGHPYSNVQGPWIGNPWMQRGVIR